MNATKHLLDLAKRIETSNSEYLHAVFGMWSRVCGIPHEKNPIKKSRLISWWSCGWRCSEEAAHIVKKEKLKKFKHDKKNP